MRLNLSYYTQHGIISRVRAGQDIAKNFHPTFPAPLIPPHHLFPPHSEPHPLTHSFDASFSSYGYDTIGWGRFFLLSHFAVNPHPAIAAQFHLLEYRMILTTNQQAGKQANKPDLLNFAPSFSIFLHLLWDIDDRHLALKLPDHTHHQSYPTILDPLSCSLCRYFSSPTLISSRLRPPPFPHLTLVVWYYAINGLLVQLKKSTTSTTTAANKKKL